MQGPFLWNTPGKRMPCLHEQIFALLRSGLEACRWHAAPFEGQRIVANFSKEKRDGLLPCKGKACYYGRKLVKNLWIPQYHRLKLR